MREKDDTVKSEQLCLFKLNCWWCVQFTMIFPLSGPKPKEQDLFKSSMPSKLFEEKCKITPAPPIKHSLVLSSFSLYCRQKERKRWVKGLITFFPQVSSVVFLFSWSPVHCAQLHTFLSLDYSILSVAQVILSSVPVALAKPPASSGLWPSAILQYIWFILFMIVYCVPAKCQDIHIAQ